MASIRTERLGDEIRAQISKILYSVKDPRLSGFITITRVNVSGDLKYAKVFYSALGNAHQVAEIKEGFKSCTGFIRRELALNMNMKYTPELTFVWDEGIERGRKTLDLINSLKEGVGDAEGKN